MEISFYFLIYTGYCFQVNCLPSWLSRVQFEEKAIMKNFLRENFIKISFLHSKFTSLFDSWFPAALKFKTTCSQLLPFHSLFLFHQLNYSRWLIRWVGIRIAKERKGKELIRSIIMHVVEVYFVSFPILFRLIAIIYGFNFNPEENFKILNEKNWSCCNFAPFPFLLFPYRSFHFCLFFIYLASCDLLAIIKILRILWSHTQQFLLRC